jgi:hypothetical protein
MVVRINRLEQQFLSVILNLGSTLLSSHRKQTDHYILSQSNEFINNFYGALNESINHQY